MPININFNKINFPDNIYLHKEKSENIHIYNLRRSPPRIIDAEIFQKEIIPGLNEKERELLLNYYIRERRNCANSGKQGASSIYLLSSVPNRISKYFLESLLNDELADSESRNKIYSLYRKEQNRSSYLLNREVSVGNQMDIINILFKKSFLITDSESTKISKILEKFKCIEWDNSFIANVHIDPSHTYFFEHHLDHVPGMLLIETARQFFTACGHIYGKIPLKGISFVLNNMNMDFFEYIWLSYPVRVELVMTKTTFHSDGYWYKCSSSINFYQEFRTKASISVTGTAVKNSILDNIIMNKHVTGFNGSSSKPGFECAAVLCKTENGVCSAGTISDISQKHFIAVIKDPVAIKNGDEFEFRIQLEGRYNTHGACTLKKYQKINGIIYGNFMISQLNPVDRDNINQIIKRINHGRERKGIF